MADKDEILIRVCEGQKVEGYSVIEVGVDAGGRYKIIRTPEGKDEKVYRININRLESFIMDRYNRLHNYRRPSDQIFLYYDIRNNDFIVVAIKPGDDLSEPPFNIKNGRKVTKDMLEEKEISPFTGLVPITRENLDRMKKMNLLTDEAANVLYFNRNNVGFYL